MNKIKFLQSALLIPAMIGSMLPVPAAMAQQPADSERNALVEMSRSRRTVPLARSQFWWREKRAGGGSSR